MRLVIDDLVDLWIDKAVWSDATFGTVDERGPIGPLKHLIHEAEEAIAEPGDIMEYADCLLLIMDASRRAGFTLEQLVAASRAKFEICKGRTYPKPGKNEAAHHI